MAYGDFKDLTRRTASDEILRDKAFNITKNPIRQFERRKVHSPFIDNIWNADPADIQLISKFSKRIFFLLCAIDIFSKYT